MRYKATYVPPQHGFAHGGGWGENDDDAVEYNHPAYLEVHDEQGALIGTIREGETLTVGAKVIAFVEGSFEFEA